MEPLLIVLLIAAFAGLVIWPWLRTAVAEIVADILVVIYGAAVKTIKYLAKAVSEVRRIGREVIASIYTFIKEKNQFYKTEIKTSWNEVPTEIQEKIIKDGSYIYEYEQ